MGAQGRIYPDGVTYDLLKNGVTNLCYDGLPFFSDAHPVGEATSSNLIKRDDEVVSPLWFLLDVSRALKPLLWQERVAPQMQQVAQFDGNISYYTFQNDAYLYGVRARGNAGYTLWQLAAASDMDLTEDNFNAVYDSMVSLKTDDGTPMRIKPGLLVVPVSLRVAALRLVNAQYLANGEDNPLYKIVDVLVSPWL
jgi:phage major head subunit gpT-like protein